MPFLFWLPMIVMSGLFNVAEHNTRAFAKVASPRDKR